MFDWDGTLHDSAEASFRSYVRLFAGFGIAFDRALFQATYSPNWHKTYEAVGLPGGLWAEADRRWMDEYGREEHSLVRGSREVLEDARSRGLLLGLVTSGSRERVMGELGAFGVRALFSSVVCSEDVRQKKPHPEGLLLALRELGTPAGLAAYIGDSPEDVTMARSAGVLSVGVPGGFPNGEALAAAGPAVLAPSLAEALRALVC